MAARPGQRSPFSRSLLSLLPAGLRKPAPESYSAPWVFALSPASRFTCIGRSWLSPLLRGAPLPSAHHPTAQYYCLRSTTSLTNHECNPHPIRRSWTARLRGTRYSPRHLWFIREHEFSTISGEREVLALADPEHKEQVVHY